MPLIAVTAQGQEPSALFDTRFGRCSYFVIFDTSTDTFRALPNPAQSEAGGAGPRAVQFLKQNNVGIVVTGHVGPHAQTALQAAGIELFEVGPSPSGTSVREMLSSYIDGERER